MVDIKQVADVCRYQNQLQVRFHYYLQVRDLPAIYIVNIEETTTKWKYWLVKY